jgi:hypothetical protein
MNAVLNITKASGKTEAFSEQKLRHSLHRAGASKEQINKVIEYIGSKLYAGISTKKIYGIAFSILKKNKGSRYVAAKYHLKKALMEMGPSGFPFEKFIAALFEHKGYRVQVGQFLKGKCVQHEVDVVATKAQEQIIVECKFHNISGRICDVKIPLYIHSRFKDIEAYYGEHPLPEIDHYQGWVVTNTRFSDDAVQYGTCAGLKMMSWDYPDKGSLRDIVDQSGLYPITCLSNLTIKEKEILLAKDVLLCIDLIDKQAYLESMNINPTRLENILKECAQICLNKK